MINSTRARGRHVWRPGRGSLSFVAAAMLAAGPTSCDARGDRDRTHGAAEPERSAAAEAAVDRSAGAPGKSEAAAGGAGATAGKAGSGTGAGAGSDRLIRSDGIAHVVPGMTIGGLRAALPSGVELGEPGPYMVDIDAMPVIDDGDTLYLVLIVSGEPRGDDARINLVATTHTALRTAEGIGPGSTLEEAAARYGRPTLTYSTNDESREYATFPGLPHTLRFRVRPASEDGAMAGIYATRGEYNETNRYDPAAIVWMAMVLVP